MALSGQTFWWMLFGCSGILLVLLNIVELTIWSIALRPSQMETELEFGVSMPNKQLVFGLMFLKPVLSLAVGIGAILGSIATLGYL